MELLQDSANEMWRDLFYWNSKGHFQGQVCLIFTYFSLLISSDEMDNKFFQKLIMHHFNETETQWTYRGPWAFYFCCVDIAIFSAYSRLKFLIKVFYVCLKHI